MEFRIDAIEGIITNAISAIEDSKGKVFEILFSARDELEALQRELKDVIRETAETIEKVDKLEKDYRLARVRLTEVSRDFHRFSEEDIKIAYEKAMKLQLDLSIYREKEIYLRARRDELQKRVRNLEHSVERAETIGSQMNVVIEYLSGDLDQVNRILESAKNRQLLGLKIIMAQEEERKRIARDIHDGPAQTLAHLVLRSEIAERMLEKRDLSLAQAELTDLKNQARSGLEEIRKVIFHLRPMALDDLGLTPTLRKYVQDFEDKSNIQTHFELVGKEIRLPSAMEVGIFRLVQEALANVMKHSSATNVSITLAYQRNMVKICVSDNGIGFDAAQLESAHKDGTHYGLIGMKERVKLLEGRMEIRSVINGGTRIEITIPTRADATKGEV
jgi:two-component system sensor histidine kinase DegS